jgi:tetratricopeptide (TPR) repeat protein
MEQARRKPTESLDAYDCYFRGLATLYRWSKRTTDEALKLFCNAIELDPRFAKAHAWAAYCRAIRLMEPAHGANREEDQAEAKRLASRAVRLGPDDAAVLSAVAMALLLASRDFDVSIALVERALTLNPNLNSAWLTSGFVRLYNGESEVAITHLEYTMRLSPFDRYIGLMWHGIAFAHLLAGRYDRSLSAAEQGMGNRVHDLCVLAASNALAGRMNEARAVVARIRKGNPTLRIPTLKVLVPLRRPEDFARFAEGLRLAGLPE